PPGELDEWPTPDFDWCADRGPGVARLTNHEAFLRLLARVPDAPESTSDAAVIQFYEWDQATRSHGDIVRAQGDHVRAWLATAFGHLLMSIALSPPSYAAELVAETHRRMLIPRQLGVAPQWGVQFAEGELSLLYNCRQSANGTLNCSGIRSGQ